MKALLLIALAFVPIILTQNYIVADLSVDQTPPVCTTVQDLLATAQADSGRLTHYVNVTIPERISKLKDVIASVQKTCSIITNQRPSLIQLSSRMNKRRAMEISNLKNLNNQVQILAAFAIGNKPAPHSSPLMLSSIQSELRTLQSSGDPSTICAQSIKANNDLLAYLNFLGPAVKSKYIDGILAPRILQLNAFFKTCFGCGTPANNSQSNQNQNNNPPLLKDGSIVALKCMGSIIVPQHTWLDTYTSSGGTGLAPTTGGGYSGTHFQVNLLADGSYSFKSLGTDFHAQYQYLDGRTGDGSVGLAPNTSGPYSGTHWQVDKLSDGTYSLKCLGTNVNPNFVYLGGGTADGTIGLFPNTNYYPYSGTHWQIVQL